MFSQRNNPYCDLLQISMANVLKKAETSNSYGNNYIFVKEKHEYQHPDEALPPHE